MKKFGILMCAFAAMSLSFTSCVDPNEGGGGLVEEIVEDGFYVLGEATVYQSMTDDGVTAATMSAGTNEVDGLAREGMYEKYMLLEGGKEFSLTLKAGTEETTYGAELEAVELDGSDDQPTLTVYKGVMTEGATLTVPEDGLYHIVLDLNTNGDLSDQLIVIAPITWAVRGGMNSWGSTDGTATAFSADDKTTMTFTWTEQSLAANGEFKFAYGGGWKIQLDEEGLVKANTNLGADMTPGGGNITVADAGAYTITLTYTLAAGSIADNYAMTTELTSVSETPTTMYINGGDFGGTDWDWELETIVEMIPVNGVEGSFWTIQYFTAANGFKFCAERAWNGDFTGLGEDTGYTVDGNCYVEADGIYMVYVDLTNSKIAIEPAAVYGMGESFADATWTENSADNLFTVNGKTLTATVANDAALRMYAASSISTSDWWTREFNIFDGVVVFRGTGGDQEAVTVTAGQTVTLDFSVANAATGTIN